MKKFISGLLIGLLLSLPLATFASGQALKLIINGQDITADAQPVIIGGRTLVPARALAEKLGATVAWDGANQAVVVTSTKEQVVEMPAVRPVVHPDGWLTIEEATTKYKDRLAKYNLVIRSGGNPNTSGNISVSISDDERILVTLSGKANNGVIIIQDSELVMNLEAIYAIKSQ